MGKPIRIDFCDFWPGFRKDDNFFYHTLKQAFNIQLADHPDFVLYANPHEHIHRLHNCVRIFVGLEWWLPDWSECDYALTPNYLEDPRHLRLPFYVPWGFGPEVLLNQAEDAEKTLAAKTGFCTFLVGKNHPVKNRKRLEFFQKLSKYKKVDSGGRFMNNIGRLVPPGQQAKHEFLRPYKFHLAFENESRVGYTTEKLYEAMTARTLPVYWGNPRIKEEFNPRSFLNYFDYGNDEALLEKIIELDKDDAKYLDYLRQPYFYDNRPNEFFSAERLNRFFERVFSTPIAPVGRRRRWFEINRWILARRYPNP